MSEAWSEWETLASEGEQVAMGRLTRADPRTVFTHPMDAYDTAARVVNHGLAEGHCIPRGDGDV